MSIKLNFANSFKGELPRFPIASPYETYRLLRTPSPLGMAYLRLYSRYHQSRQDMASGTSNQPASLLWPVRPLSGAIAAAEVHVWAWTFAGPTEPAQTDLDILDENERKRTARYYFGPDRVRYSVCHANMRRILGSYLYSPPESLVFREAVGGKPALLLGASNAPLRFNLSHSKTTALLAVALGLEVGVDVEDIRPIERPVAERFFSRAELSSMAPLDGQDWLDAFYRCWTRKEAILK